MWAIFVVSLAIGSISLTNGAIPDYIKPCSKSDPDFKKCCVSHGNEALPFILHGDKNFKIPNLLPLRYAKIDVDAGPNLKIAFADVDLYGLDTVTLTDLDVDFKTQSAYIAIHADTVSIIGNYDVDGKILVLPLKGNGPVNITFENSQFKYLFKFKLEAKEGKNYAILQPEDSLEFKIGKSYLNFQNLFNGNKIMGDNVNKFLNENQEDVLQELGGALTSAIKTIARTVGGSILGMIPFDDLFLP